MICFHIQNHCQRGVEVQEGIAVFAAFQHDGIAVTHTVACVQQGQITADHNGGVGLGSHQDVSHHGSGGGLAVSAGNADRVLIGLHDLAPGLSPLKHRNTGCTGSGDLRVVIVGSSGTDNAVRALNILSLMTDSNRNSLSDQLIGRSGSAHVRTRDMNAHSLENQSQRTHGHAANANQMHMTARRDVLLNILILNQHICQIPR